MKKLRYASKPNPKYDFIGSEATGTLQLPVIGSLYQSEQEVFDEVVQGSNNPTIEAALLAIKANEELKLNDLPFAEQIIGNPRWADEEKARLDQELADGKFHKQIQLQRDNLEKEIKDLETSFGKFPEKADLLRKNLDEKLQKKIQSGAFSEEEIQAKLAEYEAKLKIFQEGRIRYISDVFSINTQSEVDEKRLKLELVTVLLQNRNLEDKDEEQVEIHLEKIKEVIGVISEILEADKEVPRRVTDKIIHEVRESLIGWTIADTKQLPSELIDEAYKFALGEMNRTSLKEKSEGKKEEPKALTEEEAGKSLGVNTSDPPSTGKNSDGDSNGTGPTTNDGEVKTLVTSP